jgi:HK97 family phage major capsid protein
MRIFAVIGAVLAALTIGVCAAHAATPDLFAHAAGVLTFHDPVSLAMGMIPLALHQHEREHVLLNPHRARGLIGARADATEATKLFNELKSTIEAFKAEHTKELADIKKGMGDVVQSEKVDRINAEITKLQAAIDQVNGLIAAAKLGGSGGVELDPDKQAYNTAWDKFFRRGAEAGLSELAVKAAMSTDSDPDGGYMVPDQVETTIDRVLAKTSAMRRLSRVISVSGQIYKKMVNLGGAGTGWVGEKQARPQTATPILSALEFPTMELYANPAATQQFLDDAIVDVGQWLADEVNIAFSEQEGIAFVSGSGVNQPRGFLSYDTIADVNYAWGKLGFVVTGVAADISDVTHNGTDALLDLVYSLKQGYRQNATFLMNRKLQGAVRKLKDSNGDYIWQAGAQASQPASLFGYPVADDDNMSDVGANAFPVAFGDFQRGYLIVDRKGIRVLRDPYTAKPYVLFYTTKRVGGGVQNFEAIKLLKCST